jgi:hypothetical protein
MRLLIAGIAALAAVSFAAPSFAQDDSVSAPAATPTPAVKPKPGTTAYCNSLKSSSQKSSCLKRMQTAKAAKPHTTKTKKPAAPAAATPATSADTSAQAPASTMSAPSSASSVAVPPLPQKTI